MVQLIRASVHATVVLKDAPHSKLEEVASLIRVLKISRVTKRKGGLALDVSLDPRWGNWESDIRRHLHNALVKVPTTATYDLENYHRVIVERRTKEEAAALVGSRGPRKR